MIETENHEIFNLVDSSEKVANEPVIAGKYSSIAKARGAQDGKGLSYYVEPNNANLQVAKSHTISTEWGNDISYFGNTDENTYTWQNMRQTPENGNFNDTNLDTPNTKIISYNSTPGYQALFVKKTSNLLQVVNDNDLVGTQYPSIIPTINENDRWNVHYGWIPVNPGDEVKMYLVRNDYDFSGLTKQANGKHSLDLMNINDYKKFITQVKIIDADASVNKDVVKVLGDDTNFVFPTTNGTVKSFHFDKSKIAVNNLFSGSEENGSTTGRIVSRLNYENINLPKDENGKYLVGAYVSIRLNKGLPFQKSFDGIGYNNQKASDSLNEKFSFIDFNKQSDFFFSVTRESVVEIYFVPIAGYQFDGSDKEQVSILTTSNPDIPYTQLPNPLIGFDSIVGDDVIRTTKFNMLSLGKINKAYLNFKMGINLYNIKFWNSAGSEIPYKITGFDGDLDSPLGEAKWTDDQLYRLSKIMSFDAKDPFELKNQTLDPAYPEWTTIDGLAPNASNVFYPNYKTAGSNDYGISRTARFEFSFPISSEIDHITYAAPNDSINNAKNNSTTSLDWVKVFNDEGEEFDATQIGYSPDWTKDRFRGVQLDQNGHRIQESNSNDVISTSTTSASTIWHMPFINSTKLANKTIEFKMFAGANLNYKNYDA